MRLLLRLESERKSCAIWYILFCQSPNFVKNSLKMLIYFHVNSAFSLVFASLCGTIRLLHLPHPSPRIQHIVFTLAEFKMDAVALAAVGRRGRSTDCTPHAGQRKSRSAGTGGILGQGADGMAPVRKLPEPHQSEPPQRNADRCGSPGGSPASYGSPTSYGLPRPTALVAFGAIDYGEFPHAASGSRLFHRGKRLATGGSPLSPSTPAARTATPPPTSSEIPGDLNRRLREARGAFSPLPATRPEMVAIVKMYKQLTNHRVKVYTGREASDYGLQHLLPPDIDTPPNDRQQTTDSSEAPNPRTSPRRAPPRVLHLATHGFFLEERSERTDRPMTLGGLALAGANRGIMGETGPDGEDGILYALETQNLNLEGTELVVLSACDTGKGEVDYSEGVYGLTRALRTAGAKNILMTLWPLNDELAKEFMLDFYRNWLSGERTGAARNGIDPDAMDSDAIKGAATGGSAPATALHETRLAWIGSEDKRKRNPRYWAPYVLIE
uniref:CHAT domain-containing protein n=1 Tax=Candidatus Kentrum sp. FM TaxID=2126340 RepID=A0A450T5Q7_9GAMM|nr:MAG: CHAT domain-containing protein [Candidatus Kentron sp. FM]